MENSNLEKEYDSNFVCHFGVLLDKKKIRIYLNRDNYCIIDKKNYTKVPAHNEILKNWENGKNKKRH